MKPVKHKINIQDNKPLGVAEWYRFRDKKLYLTNLVLPFKIKFRTRSQSYVNHSKSRTCSTWKSKRIGMWVPKITNTNPKLLVLCLRKYEQI